MLPTVEAAALLKEEKAAPADFLIVGGVVSFGRAELAGMLARARVRLGSGRVKVGVQARVISSRAARPPNPTPTPTPTPNPKPNPTPNQLAGMLALTQPYQPSLNPIPNPYPDPSPTLALPTLALPYPTLTLP